MKSDSISMALKSSGQLTVALIFLAIGMAAWADEVTTDQDLPASIYLAFGGVKKVAFYDDPAGVPKGHASIRMVLVKPGLAYQEGNMQLRVKDAYYISERQITNLQYAYLSPGVYYADRETVHKRFLRTTANSWKRTYGDRYRVFVDQFEPYLLQDDAPAMLLDPSDALEAANLLSVRLNQTVTVSNTSQWYRYMRLFGVTDESIDVDRNAEFLPWSLHDKHKVAWDAPYEEIFRRLNEIYSEWDVNGQAPPDQVGIAWSIVWPTDTERTALREAFPNEEGRATRVVQPHSYFVRGGSLLSYSNATPKHAFSLGSMLAKQSQRNRLQGFYLTITAKEYLAGR
ncbi:MAG: hypothetical protein AB8C95_10055 [Phycisphaeraceae bacterium]